MERTDFQDCKVLQSISFSGSEFNSSFHGNGIEGGTLILTDCKMMECSLQDMILDSFQGRGIQVEGIMSFAGSTVLGDLDPSYNNLDYTSI